MQGASRFNRRAIKVGEALNLVLEAAVPGRRVTVPLREAGGRWLAESLTATTDWPPFPRSGLDGYAVRSADTALAAPESPALLRVVGTVAAGGLALAPLEQGTAVRIMTGGAVPEGADAVVMLEQTADALGAGDEPAVRVKSAAAPGQNIAQAGEEFRRGSVLAEPGTRIRPGHVALLGTFGYADVPVFARPRVAIMATGNELLPVGAPLEAGCIRDSNSSMIAAMVEQSGGEPLLLGRLADDPAAVEAALASALQQADIIITTGGVSVGDFDVMAAIIRGIRQNESADKLRQPDSMGYSSQLDYADNTQHSNSMEHAPYSESADNTQQSNSMEHAPYSESADNTQQPNSMEHAPYSADNTQQPDPLPYLLFDKVAMRPGSPTSAAVINGKLLFALSGNPGACFVGFELFVRPALLRLQGVSAEACAPRMMTAKLASNFEKGSPHERFVRTRLFSREGELYADPLAFNKSSMMASIPDAEGLIRLPAGPSGAASGSVVNVILLD
nr:molybdopterin molybdotransferase MoeA [Paenibacillus oenotherae]